MILIQFLDKAFDWWSDMSGPIRRDVLITLKSGETIRFDHVIPGSFSVENKGELMSFCFQQYLAKAKCRFRYISPEEIVAIREQEAL